MAELNTRVRMRVRASQLQSVPVDATLSIAGQAADAKATGDALALKADLSQVTGIQVNGQSADQQGLIFIDGSDIPVSGEDSRKLDAAIAALEGRTAADIPMSGETGAQSVADVINSTVNRNASAIPMSGTDNTTVKEAVEDVQEDVEDLQEDVTAIQAWTAQNVPYSSAVGAPSVKDKLDTLEGDVTAIQGWDAGDIKYAAADNDTIKDKLDDLADGRVKTVNGHAAGADGNVQLNSVPYADDLTTDDNVQVDAPFAVRTVGGRASIKSGNAWVRKLKGRCEHAGFVAEVLEMEVENAYRQDPSENISAELNKAIFREYVEDSGTIQLIYDSGWQVDDEAADPTDYGITITGTPADGDAITIEYVKEERGTITPAEPESLVATGWNLFDSSAGYARVAAYEGRYKVGGAYSTIRFATAPGETSSAIVVDENGLFDIEEDGYVILTGGNDTDTYIICCWTDWEGGYAGDFQAYEESEIDLSAIMASLTNGLCSVGGVYDEINFSTKQIIPRVKRVGYSDEARAAAEESGQAYDFDEDYIYIAMTAEETAAATSSFSLEGQYEVDEHGIEFFTGTVIPVGSEIAYGASLKDKVRRDMVTISQQTLTADQQKQILQNLGVDQLLGGLLVMERVNLFDNTTIAANGYASGNWSVAKTGYKPLIAGAPCFMNATSSGMGCSWLSANYCYLSGSKVYMQYRNLMTNAAAKIKCEVPVLYMKNI